MHFKARSTRIHFYILFNKFLFCYSFWWVHIAQSSLELTLYQRMTLILLPQPLKCWDSRYMPLCPARLWCFDESDKLTSIIELGNIFWASQGSLTTPNQFSPLTHPQEPLTRFLSSFAFLGWPVSRIVIQVPGSIFCLFWIGLVLWHPRTDWQSSCLSLVSKVHCIAHRVLYEILKEFLSIFGFP